MFRRVNKSLTCPACGVVIAEASYRALTGDLTLTSPEGGRIQPHSGAIALRIAESRLAEAPTAGDRTTAQARADFVRRNLGELIFDLRCRNGHSTLRTMPQIARALRKASGQWVDPSARRP